VTSATAGNDSRPAIASNSPAQTRLRLRPRALTRVGWIEFIRINRGACAGYWYAIAGTETQVAKRHDSRRALGSGVFGIVANRLKLKNIM
jgi:hypothetical protein